MENVLSTITVLPSTKQEITNYCNKTKEAILNGDRDILTILKHLKAVESIIKILLKDEKIKEASNIEASKYPERTFEYDNCKFQLKNAVPKYDYSKCQDSEFITLQQDFDKAKSKLDARKKWLNSLKENYVDQTTGEVIIPPTKEQAEIVSVTLK